MRANKKTWRLIELSTCVALRFFFSAESTHEGACNPRRLGLCFSQRVVSSVLPFQRALTNCDLGFQARCISELPVEERRAGPRRAGVSSPRALNSNDIKRDVEVLCFTTLI